MSLPKGYFESMYAADQDPWEFDSRWYETRKHALTVAALPSARYRSAFEPACSTGALSSLLAARCERLLAVDAVEAPLIRARERLAGVPGVVLERRELPREWPEQTFQLLVLSEFLYYFSSSELKLVVELSVASLDRGGHLVAVHWRHPVAAYPQSGDAVHSLLNSAPGLGRLVHHQEEDFLLDVFARVDPGEAVLSVARATAVPGVSQVRKAGGDD